MQVEAYISRLLASGRRHPEFRDSLEDALSFFLLRMADQVEALLQELPAHILAELGDMPQIPEGEGEVIPWSVVERSRRVLGRR